MAEGPKHLLLVDDEAALREAIAERLADHGFVVEQAASGEEALAAPRRLRLRHHHHRPAAAGHRRPAVLDAALERYPDIIAIVITGFGTVKDAVEAIKQGAADFITKPFQFDALLHVLQLRARAAAAAIGERLPAIAARGALSHRRPRRPQPRDARPVSAARDRRRDVEHGADHRRDRHRQGARGARDPPQQPAARATGSSRINCSAIPETLLEAELFGHVRGAFTGAVGTRQGRLEQAHKGTLFLDEVGTMSPALQAKLLRVLQEREFERVGDSHTIKIDVRVIAATHSDLAKMVADGTFREDLFYRLNVIPVQLPPLRERREDIPLLVQHFLQKLARRSRPRRASTMSQDALRRLMAYPWPGNVRQLENVVERALAFSQGRSQIDVQDLGAGDPAAAGGRATRPTSWFPDEGLDFERYIEGDRARADPAIARAHARQQASGGEAAEPEAHHAHREAQTARAAAVAGDRRKAAIIGATVMPPRHALLDDHPRGKADGVSRAHARRAVPTLQASCRRGIPTPC